MIMLIFIMTGMMMMMTVIVGVESFSYEWETYGTELQSRYTKSKTSIQPITACKIVAQPIRMLGHGMVMARHSHHMA